MLVNNFNEIKKGIEFLDTANQFEIKESFVPNLKVTISELLDALEQIDTEEVKNFSAKINNYYNKER